MTCLLQADDVTAPGESQSGHVVGEGGRGGVGGGVLVAKQHAWRKPKGLRKRDEQSEHCVCLRERTKPTDKSCFCRHHSLLSQFTTPAAVHCCVLSLSFSIFLSIICCMTLIHSLPVSLSLYSPSLGPCRHPLSLSDAHVFFNMSHRIKTLSSEKLQMFISKHTRSN